MLIPGNKAAFCCVALCCRVTRAPRSSGCASLSRHRCVSRVRLQSTARSWSQFKREHARDGAIVASLALQHGEAMIALVTHGTFDMPPTFEALLQLISGEFVIHDVACPRCVQRNAPAIRVRCVLRLWHVSPAFMSHSCARYSETGYVRDRVSHSIISLPPVRRAIDQASQRHARHTRGPSLSCAEWAMALVGRAVALAPDDQRRREALRQDAHFLAALVHEGEILKRDAVDRILNAGIAFGVADSAIYEILNSEFMP